MARAASTRISAFVAFLCAVFQNFCTAPKTETRGAYGPIANSYLGQVVLLGRQTLFQFPDVGQEPNRAASVRFMDERAEGGAVGSKLREVAEDGKPQPVVHKLLEYCGCNPCPQLKEIRGEPAGGDDDQAGCIRHRLSDDGDCILIIAQLRPLCRTFENTHSMQIVRLCGQTFWRP
jgi:hypothetical protein